MREKCSADRIKSYRGNEFSITLFSTSLGVVTLKRGDVYCSRCTAVYALGSTHSCKSSMPLPKEQRPKR